MCFETKAGPDMLYYIPRTIRLNFVPRFWIVHFAWWVDTTEILLEVASSPISTS